MRFWPRKKSAGEGGLGAHPKTDVVEIKSEQTHIHEKFVSNFKERKPWIIAAVRDVIQDEERLEDLFSGFVRDRVLDRKLQRSWRQSKGRFRDWTKIQFRGYVIDQLRKESRKPGGPLAISLSEYEYLGTTEDAATDLERANAQEIYDRAAAAVTALVESEPETVRNVVWAREIGPVDGREPPASIARRMSVDVNQVYRDVRWCRKQFRRELYSIVKAEVGYESEMIEDAIRDIVRLLGRG